MSGIVEKRPLRSQFAKAAMMSMPATTNSSYQKMDSPHA